MATVPVQKPKKFQSKQEADAAMARLIEEHMEEQGWSEEEWNERVGAASRRFTEALRQSAIAGMFPAN